MWTGHPESRFTFDIVADENVSQEMMFKVAGVPMVENCMEGYNSCMFAYGQVSYIVLVILYLSSFSTIWNVY